MKNVNKIIEETLNKKMKSMQNESKLRGIIRELVLEVIKEEKVNEGLFTTKWDKIKKEIDTAKDWAGKKDALIKAINKANTKIKGAWIQKLNAAKSEEEINKIIDDLASQPGKDIEDKLAGKTTSTAAGVAIFREGKK